MAEQTLWPGSVVVALASTAEPLVQVGQLLQPGLLKISKVAVQAPAEVIVLVRGEIGVGPVGSPAEQEELGLMHTGTQIAWTPVVVIVVTGVLQGFLSPGRVPRVVSERGGLLFPGSVPRNVVVGSGEAKTLTRKMSAGCASQK